MMYALDGQLDGLDGMVARLGRLRCGPVKVHLARCGRSWLW
jgi:hypothetical protein